MSGLLAGFISVTLCNPLDITRTRLNIMVTLFHLSNSQNSPSHNTGKYQGFSHTMQTIYKEAQDSPELLHNAPINQPVKRLDDVMAARELNLNYYSSINLMIEKQLQ